jgi:hypothetical protein
MLSQILVDVEPNPRMPGAGYPTLGADYRFPGGDPVNLEGRVAKNRRTGRKLWTTLILNAKIRPAAIGSAVQFCSRWSSGLS